MENLEKALERERRRIDPRQFEPVTVNTINDIKRCLAELDPSRNVSTPSVPVNATVPVDDNGRTVMYSVTTETTSKSKRDILLEGLKVIKDRMEQREFQVGDGIEINGRVTKPALIGDGVYGYFWVDPLIKQWLGADRDGIIIYWDLNDGYRYKYNIFEHLLTRVRR